MDIMLCEKFNNFNPISLRNEDAEEVVILISRFANYGKNKSQNEEPQNVKQTNNGVIRKKVYADTSTGGWY